MIKVTGTLKDGSQFVTLGLSDENWRRLRAGQPVLVRLRELDPALPDLAVLVVGGEDEPSIVEDLRAIGMWQNPTSTADPEAT
jgi:hypothetical protein